LTIALDATYSLGRHLSGVGIYSREILHGLSASHREARFLWCYRPHRFLRSFLARLPGNCSRQLLYETWTPGGVSLFHGLNQRLPQARFRRSVATFHDLFVLTGDYSTSEFRRRFSAQAREAAERSDLIIAVSEFTARQVEDLLGVERTRIRVVHHGVRFRPRRSCLRKERIILHVGAVQRRKNIIRLVEAFERVPEGWRLVLAGSPGYGAGEILGRIEASPRRRSIDVKGYVADEALEELYARASVFAFPSLDEGFGMPVLEAMAAGVPVLASTRSALAEVCGDAALFVNPNDVEEIAAALCRLTADEHLRDDYARRGRDRAGPFTWERASWETWRVYGELLAAAG
jgi:glycosyltransferase involved in cell wall biosynthesis